MSRPLSLAAKLEGHAPAIHCPRVAGAGSVAARAQELAVCIRALPHRRVNVIAHSIRPTRIISTGQR
jgi:hypothetical protein